MPKSSKWRSFRAARKFTRSLGLRNDAEWRLYTQGKLKSKGEKPLDIPTTPDVVYREKGWVGLGDWLGTGNISNRAKHEQYMPFKHARKYVRALGLKNREEWQDAYQNGLIPNSIPLKPERVYQDQGWVGCGDWLGTGYVAPSKRRYRNFVRARAFVRKLNLRSRNEWEAYCQGEILKLPKLPEDIPATPARVYREKGWVGWPNWLGK